MGGGPTACPTWKPGPQEQSSLRGLQLQPRWAPSEMGWGVRCPWHRWGPRKGPGHLVGPSPRSGICPGLAGTLCPFPRFSSVHVSKLVALGAPGGPGCRAFMCLRLRSAAGSVHGWTDHGWATVRGRSPPSRGPPLSSLTPRSPGNFLAARARAEGQGEARPQPRQQGAWPHQGVAVEVRRFRLWSFLKVEPPRVSDGREVRRERK